jgi:hypothetical protein
LISCTNGLYFMNDMEMNTLNNRGIQVKNPTKWDKAKALVKENGILKSTWLIFRYILRKTIGLDWEQVFILVRLLKEPIQEITPKINVKIRQVTEVDIDKFKNIIDDQQYQDFQKRFKKGRICFAALNGEGIVGFDWISLEDEVDPSPFLDIKLSNKEAYLFDAYMSPQYRGKKLITAIRIKQLLHLRLQGYEKALAVADSNNVISLKSCKATGFYPDRIVISFKIFGLKFSRWRKFTGTFNP